MARSARRVMSLVIQPSARYVYEIDMTSALDRFPEAIWREMRPLDSLGNRVGGVMQS